MYSFKDVSLETFFKFYSAAIKYTTWNCLALYNTKKVKFFVLIGIL
jgi:hypothetical protein